MHLADQQGHGHRRDQGAVITLGQKVPGQAGGLAVALPARRKANMPPRCSPIGRETYDQHDNEERILRAYTWSEANAKSSLVALWTEGHPELTRRSFTVRAPRSGSTFFDHAGDRDHRAGAFHQNLGLGWRGYPGPGRQVYSRPSPSGLSPRNRPHSICLAEPDRVPRYRLPPHIEALTPSEG